MSYNQEIIKKRQEFYFLGQQHEENKDLQKAIDAYKTYSSFLSDADKHIPYQWISKIYDQLGEAKQSLLALEKFANGCTPPKAAEVYKELGDSYLRLGDFENTFNCYTKAMEKNPKIGLKKKLDELKISFDEKN